MWRGFGGGLWVGGSGGDGDMLDDGEAEAFQCVVFGGVVGQEAELSDAQIAEDLGANAVRHFDGGRRAVGLDFVDADVGEGEGRVELLDE